MARAILWVLYAVPALVLMLFALNVYVMLVLYRRRRRRARRETRSLMAAFERQFSDDDLPMVVTQIPVFNEYNVAEQALRAAAAMAYPAGRHQIQVLDDSTDETSDLVRGVVSALRSRGHHIEVIRRAQRTGFKAGALEMGMRHTDAGFFALFDADFVPPPDFLRRTVPVMLMRPDVGLVQARWGHLNPNQSLVTRAQQIGIDGHFGIEQAARAWNHLFMNFNGTAGLWRRQAIEEAGGWEHDTLTEDMDLSYRAQLAGWTPYFLAELVVPAELPEDINAFKTQQFRWAKGSIQTAVKLLPRILRSSHSPLAKIEAVFHMTHYAIHPLMVWLAVFTLPMLLHTRVTLPPGLGWLLFAAVLLSTAAPLALYVAAQMALHAPNERRFRPLPALSILGVGIAVSNSLGVLEALVGKKSTFIRTPKRGARVQKSYPVRRSFAPAVELALGAYCFVSTWLYLQAESYWVGPFLLLYAVGFTSVGLLSLAHAWGNPAPSPHAA